jgi:hypothetical protein
MDLSRFKRRVILIGVACLLVASCALIVRAQPDSLPHLRQQGTATQLVVDGKPFLILGGELGNSTASSLEYMRPVWPKLVSLNLKPCWFRSIGLIEPVGSKFDFTL